MQRHETSAAERKKDAREKIILGGLIVKAGLRNAPRDFLMGAFLQIAKIDPDSEQFRSLQRLGGAVLSGSNDGPPLTPGGEHDNQQTGSV